MSHDEDATELVRLATADNFRDVAGPGYPTRDGATMRTGVFYRSNELNLADSELDRVTALGITAVYDLRGDSEVESHPSREVPGSVRTHVEIKGIPMDAVSSLTSVEQGHEVMRQVYRSFVVQSETRAGYTELLTRLAETDGPQLFHCTAGKDRTGWGSALLLHIAGVDEETTLEDYLLTNTVSSATRRKYLAMIEEHLGPDHVLVYESVMIADPSYLQAAYDAVAAHFGTMDDYLSEGLGLSAPTTSALRARMLEA